MRLCQCARNFYNLGNWRKRRRRQKQNAAGNSCGEMRQPCSNANSSPSAVLYQCIKCGVKHLMALPYKLWNMAHAWTYSLHSYSPAAHGIEEQLCSKVPRKSFGTSVSLQCENKRSSESSEYLYSIVAWLVRSLRGSTPVWMLNRHFHFSCLTVTGLKCPTFHFISKAL